MPGAYSRGRLTGKISASRKPVLIVQHAPHEHPAIVRRALETQGIPTLWVHAYRGEVLPELAEIRGMISLGGPMGANDEAEFPWIRAEINLMRACVDAGTPVAGICLGGQMLARAMGAEVTRNPVGEVGWFPIELNEAGSTDRILGGAGASPIVYHWHNDTFGVPNGATLLASSSVCSNQAYRINARAYGFQFHPEADHQLVHEWMAAEGIEEEIDQALSEHGTATVQDMETQKNRAIQGEKASLKITSGISQLFNERAYLEVSSGLAEQIQRHFLAQTDIILEFESSSGQSQVLRGQIKMTFGLTDGDFIVFKERSTLLWPLRVDSIRSLKAANPPKPSTASR